MQFFVAKVTWYDETIHPGPATNNIVICADSFESVTSQIMDYFGEGVETINLQVLNPDRPFMLIEDNTYEDLLRSEC